MKALWVIWSGQLLTVMGFSIVIPFLPLFLQELGINDPGELAIWSGVVVGSPSLFGAVTAPIWGALGDRFGLKAMVLRAQVLGGLVVLLMAISPSAGWLVVFRMIQGMLGGSIGPNAALAATVAPPGRLGFAMGLVQMAVFTGASLGPLVGGFLADTVGMRGAFVATAVFQFTASALVALFVKSSGRPTRSRTQPSVMANLREIVTIPALLAVISVSFVIQFSSGAVQPVIPLFVQSMSETGAVATTIGIVFGLTAFTSAISSVLSGRFGDQFGQRILLLVALTGAAIMFIPQAFAQTALQLMIARTGLGLFIGGGLPTINVLAMRIAGAHRRAAAIGIVQSSTSLGLAVGPLVGAALMAWKGFALPFYATGGLLLLAAVFAFFFIPQPPVETAA